MRKIFIISSIVTSLVILGLSYFWPSALFLFIIVGPLIYKGIMDIAQKRQAIRIEVRVLGHIGKWRRHVRHSAGFRCHRMTPDTPTERKLLSACGVRSQPD